VVVGLVTVLILAGCGGSGSSKVLTVRGDGFSFGAPAGWTVGHQGRSASASDGAVDRVQVLTFTLEKPYRPELFPAVTGELDRAAAGLAAQLNGHVTDRSTVEIDGRKARSYDIQYGGGRTEEIAFVLEGTNEYELLCRRATSASAAACDQLFSSFAIG
jgi:hypothetical protein